MAAMNEQAAAHPRYGYRMVCTLLQRAGWRVNRKRIARLWRLEGHRVPPQRSKASGKKAWGAAENASWNRPATAPNHTWSYDFVSARTRRGVAIRILNVVTAPRPDPSRLRKRGRRSESRLSLMVQL